MYAPYPENMMESIKKVEATRAQRMATEPRRLTADEKDALLKKFHPDYNPDAFAEIKVGPNKGQKAPLELADMLHSTSRLMTDNVDLTKVDYDVDVLVIGGGGAGSSCAIEAHKAGANVMIVTKLRIGDANTMMAEGGIQAADKENDSPVQHYLDCFGGGHFAAKPELVKRLDPETGSQRLINLMTAWKHEIKELMGGMGINSIEALRGNRLMLRGIGLNEKELEILGISHAGE